MMSVPRVAGTLAASAFGLVAASSVLVPSAALAQQAPAYPPTGGGGETVVTTPFVAPPAQPATLPFTGGEIATATALGLGAVAAGGALLVAGRRRRAQA